MKRKKKLFQLYSNQQPSAQKAGALDSSATLTVEELCLKVLRDHGNTSQYICQIDYGKMCIGTDCQTKSAFFFTSVDIIYYPLQNFA